MDPWIQVYAKLLGHRKICKLRTALALKGKYEAVGIIVSVWLWAAQNAADGNLSGYAPEDIADAIGYKKPAGKLLDALVSVGFVDRGEDGTLTLHDWDEHAALLQSAIETQKEKNRKRVQEYRNRKKAERNANATPEHSDGVTGDVTLHATEVMPPPNQTVPYQTNISGAGDESARAEKATPEELAMIGLMPGEYLNVTRYTVERTIAATRTLFKACGMIPEGSSNAPSPFDCKNVFLHAALDLTAMGADIVPARVGLLRYAFEAAHAAGRPGNWNYVAGVMARCNDRGITTAKQAREWDLSHADRSGEEAT